MDDRERIKELLTVLVKYRDSGDVKDLQPVVQYLQEALKKAESRSLRVLSK
jgi:hypothetical protein